MTLISKRENMGIIPSFQSSLTDLFNVNRFFDNPFLDNPMQFARSFTKTPATNIRETDDEYILELAAPGMKKEDFHVDIDNNMLEIKAEQESEYKDDQPRFTRREYDYTSFYRSFNLPETVQSEKIKAEYRDGILQIHLPKIAEAKRKLVKEIAVV